MRGVCNKRTVGAADSRPLLFTDLDNTLIYSYKREIGNGKVAVEVYQGRIISYMTGYSHDTMMRIREELHIIPVTTRSISQYRRVVFGGLSGENPGVSENVYRPRFALTSNGGNLLIDGEPDESWKKESLKLISSSLEQLREAENLLASDPDRSFEIRQVDDFFTFTKSDRPEKTCERLSEALDSRIVSVRQNGSKVYVVPGSLDKGTAVRRFLARFNAYTGPVLCAGDSDFDVSFLSLGDRAFCPAQLCGRAGGLEAVCPAEGEVLSDVIFEYLQKALDAKEK